MSAQAQSLDVDPIGVFPTLVLMGFMLLAALGLVAHLALL